MEQNYIYAPAHEHAGNFRCKVPMKGTRQIFTIDGSIQGTGRQLDITFEKGLNEEALQVISVRTSAHKEHLISCSSYTFCDNAEGRLILCSHTFSDDPFETEETIRIDVGENAIADITVMQNEHNGASHNTLFNINMGTGSVMKMTIITLHGGNISNNVSVSLNGCHGECEINGIYLVDGKQIVTNNININHNVPECYSRQLFKGILNNEGTANFSGLIKVVSGAQKTEAYQENHNIILSNRAMAYSEPQLEIYADDVKCSHGATNGNLDENELFYMRSRGIPVNEAKLLQQMAFAHAVIEKIQSKELRERISDMVEQRLRGDFSDCRNCCRNCC